MPTISLTLPAATSLLRFRHGFKRMSAQLEVEIPLAHAKVKLYSASLHLLAGLLLLRASLVAATSSDYRYRLISYDWYIGLYFAIRA